MDKVNKLFNCIILSIFMVIILSILVCSPIVYSQEKIPSYNVLVINSYSIESEWEKLVNQGLDDIIQLKNNNISIDLNYEFLDTNIRKDPEYLKTFEELLEKKYEYENLDAIVTIDDEAYNIMKKLIFDENSIFYNKLIVFVGVNQKVELTTEEKKYITGLLEIEDNLEALGIILKLHENIQSINVIIDESIYGTLLKSNIESIKNYLKKPININYIQYKYIEDVVREIKILDQPNQINFISGAWLYKTNNQYVKSADTVKLIDNSSTNPIYTGRQSYIDKGVIGGFIDIGQEHGKMAGNLLIGALKNSNGSIMPSIQEPSGKFVFDYKKIYEYDLDILKIPENSVIINKQKYELLIPKKMKIALGIISVSFVCLIVVIIYMGIMESKKYKKSKILYEKSKERENLKTNFVVNMSHELRTPLNVILSTTRLLEIKANNNEDIKNEYLVARLHSIKQNSHRLLRLVNNLIDITKFEVGVYEVYFENLNIVEVVEETIESTIDFARKKDIDVIFDTDKEEIIMAVDREKIERIILNLLSNAIKFTGENGEININIKSENEHVYIDIRDNGIGIPEDKVKEIFQRFYQVENTLVRANEGSGIGLCIVEELVHLHKGKISVESKANVGTKFTITLPIDKIEGRKETKKLTSMDLKELAKLELSDIEK